MTRELIKGRGGSGGVAIGDIIKRISNRPLESGHRLIELNAQNTTTNYSANAFPVLAELIGVNYNTYRISQLPLTTPADWINGPVYRKHDDENTLIRVNSSALFTSTDEGKTWTKKTDFDSASIAGCVVKKAANAATLWAGRRSSGGIAQLFSSDDYGVTWSFYNQGVSNNSFGDISPSADGAKCRVTVRGPNSNQNLFVAIVNKGSGTFGTWNNPPGNLSFFIGMREENIPNTNYYIGTASNNIYSSIGYSQPSTGSNVAQLNTEANEIYHFHYHKQLGRLYILTDAGVYYFNSGNGTPIKIMTTPPNLALEFGRCLSVSDDGNILCGQNCCYNVSEDKFYFYTIPGEPKLFHAAYGNAYMLPANKVGGGVLLWPGPGTSYVSDLFVKLDTVTMGGVFSLPEEYTADSSAYDYLVADPE